VSSDAATEYEQWTLGLRAWRVDPLTDLSGLPPLRNDSLPPAAFQRLLRHLHEAIEMFMKRWQEQLVAATADLRDEADAARALVDARRRFAQRLRLAAHPGLPEDIQLRLRAQAEIDLRSIQAELEGSVLTIAGSGARSAQTDRETLLRIYRENALTAALDPSFISDSVDDREMHRANAAEQLIEPVQSEANTNRWTASRRRVFIAPGQD
jgi:hypothetical protein